MSDFTSNFWAIYVAVLSLFSIVGLFWFFWFWRVRLRAMTDADNTTGHVWDGDLREFNNPLPRWWTYLFVLTVVFALVLSVLVPRSGQERWSIGLDLAMGQMLKEIEKRAMRKVAPIYAKYVGLSASGGG